MILLVLGFAGGSFIQVDSLPAAMQRIAPFSPLYWGTTGYRELLQGGSAAQVLPHAGILAAIGAILLIVGGRLLGRKVRSGGVA